MADRFSRRGKGGWLALGRASGRLRRLGALLESLVLLAVLAGLYAGLANQSRPEREAGDGSVGLVMTDQVLDRWYPRPVGPNAADLYRQAFEAMVDRQELVRLFHACAGAGCVTDEPPAGDTAARVSEHVTRQARAIALLEAATQIEGCRFEVDVSADGYASQAQPHHRGLSQSAQLLYLAGRTELESPRLGPVCRRIGQIIRIAEDLGREPSMTGAFQSYRVRTFAYDLADRVLESGRAGDDELQTLGKLLGARDSLIPRWYIDSGICNANTFALRRSATTSLAQARVRLVAIGVERYRRDFGVVPAGLDALTPAYLDAVPMDPFGYQPLKYRVEGGTAIIYSVGADRIDQAGKTCGPYTSAMSRGVDIGVVLAGPVAVASR